MRRRLNFSIYRRLQFFLGRHGHLYLRLLRWTGRGSLEKKVFLALLRDGDVVFDIGANQGYFTLLFSDIVGSEGHVHAFEPVPSTFQRLRSWLAENRRFDNVRLNEVACAEQPAEVTMMMPGNDSGQASLRMHHEGSWKSPGPITQYAVKAIRLDDYFVEQALSRVDFIKCDIEGAELPALRGMTRLLALARPPLFLEVYSHWTRTFGYAPGDLIAFLELAGYDSFYLVSDRVQRLFAPRQELAVAANEHSCNVLCVEARRHRGRLRRLAAIAPGHVYRNSILLPSKLSPPRRRDSITAGGGRRWPSILPIRSSAGRRNGGWPWS